MGFTGNEGTFLKSNNAATLTAAWRSANPSAVQAEFFGITNINTILNQSGCVGLRIYLGLDSSGNIQLVLCGATSNENDMLNYILDTGVPCPTQCGAANVLNS